MIEDSTICRILHISDIHAGSYNFNSCTYIYNEYLYNIIKEEHIDYLVCSGDLIYKGNSHNYSFIDNFFCKITSLCDVIIVPGNHDICNNEKLFESFDRCARRINDKIEYKFSKDLYCVYKTENVNFILTNSAYLGDHKYGQIDINKIDKILKDIDNSNIKILITHHPFLADKNDGCSSVRNSRDVLQYLAENSIKVVFHGHQHMNSRFGYKFKNNIVDIIGVRSLSLNDVNIPIGAQIVFISNSDVHIEQIDLSKDREVTW